MFGKLLLHDCGTHEYELRVAICGLVTLITITVDPPSSVFFQAL